MAIPFDDRIQPVRGETAPTLSADFEMANIRATEKLGNTIQQISEQTGAMALDYSMKNKNADMAADEMAYRTKKLEVLQNAKLAASKTSNSKEIDSIYKEAQNSINKYATGNDQNGNPNIRWKDQVASIQSDSNQFRVQLEEYKIDRKMKLSNSTTRAKSKHTMAVSIENRDINGFKKGTSTLVSAGAISSEEKKYADMEGYISIGELDMKDGIAFGDKDLYENAIDSMVKNGGMTKEWGLDRKAEYETKINYSESNYELSMLRENYRSGELVTSEYIGLLDALRKDVNSKSYMTGQKKTILSNISASVGNAKKTEQTARQNAEMDIYQESQKGEFNQVDYIKFLGPKYGEKYGADSLDKWIIAGDSGYRASQSGTPEGDASQQAWDIGEKIANGKLAIDVGLKSLNEIDSPSVYPVMVMISSAMEDQGSLVAYDEKFGIGKSGTIKMVGLEADAVRTVANYIRQGGLDGNGANEFFRKHSKFKSSNQNPTREEYTEFMTDTLKNASSKLIANQYLKSRGFKGEE